MDSESRIAAPEEPHLVEPISAPLPAAHPSWLRLAYCGEFLLALLTGMDLWSQVGGQAHLDLMAWYVKLLCIIALAWASVRLTAAIVEHGNPWNTKTRLWLLGLLVTILVMGGVTLWYHLHEVPENADTDETTSTSVSREFLPFPRTT